MKKFINILKKYGPWLVAGLMLVYLINKYDPRQLAIAFEYANLPFFLGISIIYFMILYLVDTRTLSFVFTRFGYKITTKELFAARGVTYLIMIINYPASQAAFAYYLKKTKGVPIFEALGVFFFVAIIDLFIVITLGFVGSFLQEATINGIDVSLIVQRFAILAYLGLLIHFVFWRGIKKDCRAFRWIKSKQVFHVFNSASVRDYLKVALLRSPIHVSIIVFLYVALYAFQVHAPMINILGDIPIAFLVGTIPITPGGLGTTNYMIVEMLSPYVRGDIITNGIVTAKGLIFAVTILWTVTNYSLKALVGLITLRRVSKELFKPDSEEEGKKVESEATHLMGDI